MTVGGRRRGIEWAILAAATLAPALAGTVLAVRLAFSGLPAFNVHSDMAVTELATRSAAHGRQLLGPYSRFGFNHPGPLMFYLLAPLYAASGGSFSAMLLTAVIANTALLFVMALIAWRAGGPRAGAVTGVALALLVLFLGPAGLCSVWNPNLTILPFAAAIFACAAVVCGRPAWLPVAVAAGSLALQSHLAVASPLAAAAGVTLLLLVWKRLRRWLGLDAEPHGQWWPQLTASAVLALVLWAPVIYQELTGSPGNLTKIARFLLAHSEGHTIGMAVRVVLQAMGAFLLAPVTAFTNPEQTPGLARAALALGCAQVLGLGLTILMARRKRLAFPSALAVLDVVLVGAAVIVARGITGPILDYLVRWMAALGFTGTAALLVAAIAGGREPTAVPGVGRRRPLQLAGIAVASLALLVANLVRVVQLPALAQLAHEGQYQKIGRITAEVRQALQSHSISSPVVSIRAEHPWDPAAGVILQLEKEGRHVGVDGEWLRIFGPAFTPRASDGVLVFADPSQCTVPFTTTRVEVANERDVCVFLELNERNVSPPAGHRGGVRDGG